MGNAVLLLILILFLTFLGHNNPHDDVRQNSGQTARQHQEQKKQAKPPGIDAKKLAQAAAHARDDAILSFQFFV